MLYLWREDAVSWEFVADEYLGEMPDEASRGLSQVQGSNLDMNWAAKIVWVIILSAGMFRHVSDNKRVLGVLSYRKMKE